jgi:hypothetical protein
MVDQAVKHLNSYFTSPFVWPWGNCMFARAQLLTMSRRAESIYVLYEFPSQPLVGDGTLAIGRSSAMAENYIVVYCT